MIDYDYVAWVLLASGVLSVACGYHYLHIPLADDDGWGYKLGIRLIGWGLFQVICGLMYSTMLPYTSTRIR